MADLDPGRLMPPVPKGWQMHSRDGAGIVLPYFTRKDGVSVKFATAAQSWAAYSSMGEMLKEFGTSHTPGGMMAHVDRLEPLAGAHMPVGPEFDVLFRELMAQGLFTVGFRDGQMIAELMPKGDAALAILGCVKAGQA